MENTSMCVPMNAELTTASALRFSEAMLTADARPVRPVMDVNLHESMRTVSMNPDTETAPTEASIANGSTTTNRSAKSLQAEETR